MTPKAAPSCPPAPGFFVPAVRMLALAVVVGLTLLRARADEPEYQINVRSEVERAFKGLGKEALREHGKVYTVISIEQIDNPENKLVRPVNEFALLKNLNRVLAAHGFREAAAGTNPEILVTVLYGRGWLKNPYTDDGMIETDAPGIDGIGAMGGRTVTIVGIPKDAMRHLEPGYEEKQQRADGEKLIINVTAWEYRGPRKEGEKRTKPKQLWHTTINTDDADQDLNAQMEKMLAAGAVYFDRVIDKEELTVSSSLPEGHVNVGTPTVVEPPKSGK
ncbi:MAG: hypothetical protein JWM88_1692 [Verrucomicrobia bacterium]|nr:hypothetical protein [Verrucomicrobiota bacterium]